MRHAHLLTRAVRLGAVAGFAFTVSACALSPGAAPPRAGVPTAAQIKTFGPMARLAGRTWRSEDADPAKSEAGPADISAWSFDLGGRVIVSRHALEDGSYGGVTYVYENGQTGSLDYVYVTSAGFHTTGTFQLAADGSWTAEEAVTGHETITRVRSTTRFLPDGRMAVMSEYLSKGAWSPGRNVVYAAVNAKVPEITGSLRN